MNEVFEQLGLASAPVAGISEGGAVVLRFALAFPKRVDRLTLLAPAVSFRANDLFPAFAD
jgi:pimeloyl-ACP methyl ester carboxylesterase